MKTFPYRPYFNTKTFPFASFCRLPDKTRRGFQGEASRSPIWVNGMENRVKLLLRQKAFSPTFPSAPYQAANKTNEEEIETLYIIQDSRKGKGMLGIGNARQLCLSARRRRLMCRIHLVFRTGALHTSTVQPKAGRSENIYWLCKVSLLLPPSSLGLDGHAQYLSWFEDIQEVPEKPSSPCSPIGFPCTQYRSHHQPKGYRESSLNWLLPSQKSSTP